MAATLNKDGGRLAGTPGLTACSPVIRTLLRRVRSGATGRQRDLRSLSAPRPLLPLLLPLVRRSNHSAAVRGRRTAAVAEAECALLPRRRQTIRRRLPPPANPSKQRFS